jgi:hypothetical protein
MISKTIARLFILFVVLGAVACTTATADQETESSESEEVDEAVAEQTAQQQSCTWVNRESYSPVGTNLCMYPCTLGGDNCIAQANGMCTWRECVRGGRVISRTARSCRVPLDRTGCPSMGCYRGQTCVMWGRCQGAGSCVWR